METCQDLYGNQRECDAEGGLLGCSPTRFPPFMEIPYMLEYSVPKYKKREKKKNRFIEMRLTEEACLLNGSRGDQPFDIMII